MDIVYSETGILMTPPGEVTHRIVFLKEVEPRTLLVYGSVDYLLLDPEDFEMIKDARVWLCGGELMMQTGMSIEEFLGIKGRRASFAPKFDYRRRWYDVK